MQRVARLAGSAVAALSSDISRAALAEGACVEAFAAEARAAVVAAAPLPFRMAIEYVGSRGGSVAFTVDRASARLVAAPAWGGGGSGGSDGLPEGPAPILERGDLAGPQTAPLFSPIVERLNAGLTPSQLAAATAALADVARTFGAAALVPVDPPPTPRGEAAAAAGGLWVACPARSLPLRAVLETMGRLATTAGLPAPWPTLATAATLAQGSDEAALAASPLVQVRERLWDGNGGGGSRARRAASATDL